MKFTILFVILCLSTLDLASETSAKVIKVESLNEQYLDANKDVFLREGFEEITTFKGRFHDISDNNGNFFISKNDAFIGTQCAQQRYIPKEKMEGDPGNAGWITYFFGDNPLSQRIEDKSKHTRVFSRWYHKFEEGFQPDTDENSMPPKMARMRVYTKNWKDVYTILFWIAGKDGHISIERHTKAPGNSRDWLPKYHTKFAFLDKENIGRWIHLELGVTLGEGKHADRIQAWADGVLICDIQKEDLAAGHRQETLNAMMLDCYWNGGSPVEQSRYYDDWVLSKNPIGPARTTTNPLIHLTKQQQQIEIEVATINQSKVPLSSGGNPAQLNPRIVWTSTIKPGQSSISIDDKTGTFTGTLKSKKKLEFNQLHMIRLKTVNTEWTAWHSGFATQHADSKDSSLPQGYQIN